MATEGFHGFYVETRNYGATAAFWARALDVAMPFTPQHWNVLEAHVRDPDGP